MVPLTMIKIVNANDSRKSGCLVTKLIWCYCAQVGQIGANGRPFSAHLTRPKVVFETSSVRRRVPRMAYSFPSKLRTNFIQMPPYCGPLGGFNVHNVILRKFRGDVERVDFSMHSRSSFSNPTLI